MKTVKQLRNIDLTGVFELRQFGHDEIAFAMISL